MENGTNENPILARRTKKYIKTSSLDRTKNYKDQTASRVDIHSSQLTRLTYSGSQPWSLVKTGLTGFKNINDIGALLASSCESTVTDARGTSFKENF